jgi:hypothetical protein
MPLETKIGPEAEKIFEIKKIGPFLKNLLGLGVIAAVILTLTYLIWGAIDWITSAGDQEKLKSARNRITAALIGLALMALVWLIWRLALYFLGIGIVGKKEVILPLGD